MNNQQGISQLIGLFLTLTAVAIVTFMLVAYSAPFKNRLFSSIFPKPLSHASGQSTVTISNGKLYIDGVQFKIKGINYNPIYIGSDQIDTNAPNADVPKIADLGANTVGTYFLGQAEWGQWSDLNTGQTFYNNLYPVAERYNLKIIVGYFSNQTIDWTDSTRVAKVTSQYQQLVTQASSRPSTLVYLIGNEVFEKMSDDTQRKAYATWIGQMVNWTHLNDPNHPVMYADQASHTAIPWLKSFAPAMDIYGLNDYEWGTVTELQSAMSSTITAWPGKPILLHEWGVDSWDVPNMAENQAAQSTRVQQLLSVIDQIYQNSSYPLLGSAYFELTDDWNKLGSPSVQDPDQGWPYSCHTSFDQKCNEEWWGLMKSAASGQAVGRTYKSSFSGLKAIWASFSTPAPTQVPTLIPSATPSCSKGSLGDINCDRLINIFDYNILVTNFSKTETNCTNGDLDCNGMVNIFDYNILVTNFGK